VAFLRRGSEWDFSHGGESGIRKAPAKTRQPRTTGAIPLMEPLAYGFTNTAARRVGNERTGVA